MLLEKHIDELIYSKNQGNYNEDFLTKMYFTKKNKKY